MAGSLNLNNGCVKQVYNICMASDFFYPNTGGVESHIFQLSQCLIQRGHKVVVITHEYDDRKGVRYMTNGLKVYYLPFQACYNQCIFPSLFRTGPLVRNILIRESIAIVHGHSAFSALAHETMIHAKNLGLKTVFTDHSLFGFADASAIVTNKILELSLQDCDSVICVSHVGKENTVLRAKLDEAMVYVIPNAVDSVIFAPDVSRRDPRKITVVVLSRLVYRKGTDFLVSVVPALCAKYPNVHFVIAGDGPKKIEVEEMIEQHELYGRVKMCGPIEHCKVREVLVNGDIFLNTSLTEAYCMAIVEAASCGLQVVSTDVGGIPEVLPAHPDEGPGQIMWLTKPSVHGIICGLEKAISDLNDGKLVDPESAHQWVQRTYNWHDVVLRTEHVYDVVCLKPRKSLGNRLEQYLRGTLWQKVFCFMLAIDYIVLQIVNWFQPAHHIDRALRYDISDGL